MRRASAELEKRRASLGATRGLRSDGTLDPYHAAILFRDSRGVSAHLQIPTDYAIVVRNGLAMMSLEALDAGFSLFCLPVIAVNTSTELTMHNA